MAGLKLVNQVWINWRDINGGTSATGWTNGNQASLAPGPFGPLLSAAAALSRAAPQNALFQQWIDFTGTATAGPYSTVMDQAKFQATSEDYTRIIAIPAPQESIFLPDGITIDMSNSLVVAFLAQVQALLGTTQGNPWTGFPYGYRGPAGVHL